MTVLPFPNCASFALVGRTLRESSGPAIRGNTQPGYSFAGYLSEGRVRGQPSAGPRGDLAAVAEPKLDQDVLHVVLRRPLGYEQGLADLLVGQPPPDQPSHLELTRAQRRTGQPAGR